MNHCVATMRLLVGLFVLPQPSSMFLVLLLKLFVLAWIKNKALIFGRAVWVISAV